MSQQSPFADLSAAIAKNLARPFAAFAKAFASFGLPRSPPSAESCPPPTVVTIAAGDADSRLAEASPADSEEAAFAGLSPTVANAEQVAPVMPEAAPAPRPRRAAPKSGKIAAGDVAGHRACLVPIADPELDAIRARVASLEMQVVDLETRKAEMEQLIDEFAFCQYRALGELLGEQLRLQHELLRLRAERSAKPEDRQAAADAAEEYQAYQQARAEPDAAQAVLADSEREELKALYRAAVMRCHPDRVDEAAKPLAHEMFLRTQDAYRRRDLETMRLLSRQLAAGDTTSPSSDGSTPRERLEVLRESLLDKGAELLLAIQSIRMQAQYRRALNREQWEDYFAAARERLEKECGALRQQLSGC